MAREILPDNSLYNPEAHKSKKASVGLAIGKKELIPFSDIEIEKICHFNLFLIHNQ